MHVTFDPLVLLTVLAFIIPWGDAAKRVRAAWFCLLAWRLRRRLERETGARVLVYVGRIERSSTFSLIRKIRATPPTRRLELVLDTTGGDPDAGRAVLHALASHPAKVVVRVPDECWSAGSIIAAGADEVVLAPVMESMGMAAPETIAQPTDPGDYQAKGEFFSMIGEWRINVRVNVGGNEEVARFTIQTTQQ